MFVIFGEFIKSHLLSRAYHLFLFLFFVHIEWFAFVFIVKQYIGSVSYLLATAYMHFVNKFEDVRTQYSSSVLNLSLPIQMAFPCMKNDLSYLWLKKHTLIGWINYYLYITSSIFRWTANKKWIQIYWESSEVVCMFVLPLLKCSND